jgi:hypothetical protein
MTTEVAVLNRSAVALAADSAVTLQGPEGPKIYQTNKLFTLSKFHPVGIMVYGAAVFMDVPWEIIIKRYRSELGRRAFPTLAEYGAHFRNFLERDSTFFPASRQRVHLNQFARWWLRRLKYSLRKSVNEKLQSSGSVSDRAVRSIFRNIVNEDIAHLRSHKNIPRFSRTSASSIVKRYRNEIRGAIQDELQVLVGAVPIQILEMGCALAITRDLYWPSKSGVVIAGFGKDDVFPHVHCHELDSIIDGKLRCYPSRERHIAPDRVSASLMAFAQGEMVGLFMNGIDEDFAEFIRGFISGALLKGYPSLIEKSLGRLMSPSQTTKIRRRLRQIGNQLSSKLELGISEYMKKYHSDPIVEIIDHLPKEELAAMAEALVNLTSFKRHVTRQAETVGGPIDVAIISQGDGFVWIKRKHYFSQELNPHFISSYFRKEEKRVRGNS